MNNIPSDLPARNRHFTVEAGVALLFAILYFGLFLHMVWRYNRKDYKWRSKHTLLFSHVCIRVVSQALGVAFGILVFDNVDVFVAYLVLSAEGYFTLTLTSYLFLKSWHRQHLGYTWLAKRIDDKNEQWKHALAVVYMLPLWTPWRYKDQVMDIVHAFLIPANVLIVTGGAYLAGTTEGSDKTPEEVDHAMHISKMLRTTGSAVFFAMTVLFVLCLIKTQSEARQLGLRLHFALLALYLVAFFLHVRGIFGVLQAAIYKLSYTNPVNYTRDGFTGQFTALEYCLAVLPEFSAAFLLNMPCFLKAREHVGSQEARSRSRETDEVTLENGHQATNTKSAK